MKARRVGWILGGAAFLFGVAVWSASARPLALTRTAVSPIPADPPPAASTWPAYPSLPSHSCFSRSGDALQRSAPSFLPAAPAHIVSSKRLVQQFLARFGDPRYIRTIVIGALPGDVRLHLKGHFGLPLPARDSRWAYIGAPAAHLRDGTQSSGQVVAAQVAKWEADLAAGGLRDEFCAAHGPALVGDTVEGSSLGSGPFDSALVQRFPNPTPRQFRARLKLIAERYGFAVVSLRLLHPGQLAPLLVVKTTRDRNAFVKDIPAIESLLNPRGRGSGNNSPTTFEGFFFEAEDAAGPFVAVQKENRGVIEGGQWAAVGVASPFLHG